MKLIDAICSKCCSSVQNNPFSITCINCNLSCEFYICCDSYRNISILSLILVQETNKDYFDCVESWKILVVLDTAKQAHVRQKFKQLLKCGHSFGFEKDSEENMPSMSWIDFKTDMSFQENKDDNQNISRTILTQTGKDIAIIV